MNYKQINYLTDDVMPVANPNTFKVVMHVARATWGWKKNSEKISLSDFQAATGINSRKTVVDAIKDAIEQGFITRTSSGRSFYYAVNGSKTEPIENTNGSEIEPTSVQKSNHYRFRNRTDNGSKTEPITSGPKEYTEYIKNTTEGNRNGAFAAVVREFENNIGMITPILSDAIGDAFDEFGADWVTDAIGIATRQNKRSWSYINGILKRWSKDGKQDIRPTDKKIVKNADGSYYV